ncbi:osmotically inducible protein OsmC [Vibrio parahaemolyticus]|nr:osmotically inducible protein OsmC [Vibrio antiquarius]EJG0102939.1 osmotically inducible protein OsmC [Vibrio parahaemolyticus]EJG0563044.1 osmotically inducible protein OsmC [Vibrio parahaemolyticus]EJG0570009.1 osmotically inducible protein OsmC [Vibrio parahaemolyticus]EJI6682997.1 osmotically inducible protein OsmC [Vibrio parahaemolyticus]
MKAEVKWIEDLKFVGKTDKNQEIIMASGDSTYFSPMEDGRVSEI